MGGLFGKPKVPKEREPHMALQDRQMRDLYEENRTYTALDAALGIRKPRTRQRQRP